LWSLTITNISHFVEPSPDYLTPASQLKKKSTASISKTPPGGKESERFQGSGEGHLSRKGKSRTKTKSGKKRIFSESSPPSVEDLSDNDVHIDLHEKQVNGSGHKASHARKSFAKDGLGMTRPSSCVGDTGSQQGCASGGRNFQSSRSPSKVIF